MIYLENRGGKYASWFFLWIFSLLSSIINSFSIMNNFFHIFTKSNFQERLTGLFNQYHPCLGRGFHDTLPLDWWLFGGMILQFWCFLPCRERERASEPDFWSTPTPCPQSLHPQGAQIHCCFPTLCNYISLIRVGKATGLVLPVPGWVSLFNFVWDC